MVRIKHFFQRYWVLVLLAFIATVIVGIVLIRPKLGPPVEIAPTASLKRPVLPQAKILDTKISYQLDLSDESPEAPRTLPVYQAHPREEFDYSALAKPNLEGEQVVSSPEQAAGYAKGFLEKNKRWTPELENGEYETNFLKIGGFEVFKALSFADADIIAVLFYPEIDNYLIVGKSPFSGSVEVWVGRNAQIQKVEDFLADYETTDSSTYPLLSFTQAWEAIIDQKGSVVSLVKQEEAYDQTIIGINSIRVTQAFLAYYQPFDLPSSLQPIWVFKGIALLQDRTESEVGVYLPAIEETYFIPEL